MTDTPAFATTPSPSTHASPRPTAAVRGSAERDVAPDYAVLSGAITWRDAVRERAVNGASQALDVLHGVVDDLSGVRETRMSSLRVERLSVRRGDSYQPGDWSASVSGAIEVATAHVPAAVSALAGAGLAISWVGWRLDEDNEAWREVRIAAVHEARRMAEDFAVAVGRTLGDLVSVADPGLLGAGAMVADSSAYGAPASAGGWSSPGGSGPAEVALDPAPVNITATVHAVYTLG